MGTFTRGPDGRGSGCLKTWACAGSDHVQSAGALRTSELAHYKTRKLVTPSGVTSFELRKCVAGQGSLSGVQVLHPTQIPIQSRMALGDTARSDRQE
jgi:hypothetical protein